LGEEELMSATYTLIIQFTGPIGIKEEDFEQGVYDSINKAGGEVREFILQRHKWLFRLEDDQDA
jgi:hypothetical protein